MSRTTTIALGTAVIVSVIGYMAYLGASSSWRYYVLVDECAADTAHLAGHRLRVSGRVAMGTLHISDDRRTASFQLRGTQSEVDVRCRGLLPDNLSEDMDVVVEGVLQTDGRLQGDRVITRCASKYAPKGASGSSPGEPRPTS